jgi:membrane-bound metal-dependent hydrolase YbcI (DUF457 family)
MFLGHFGVAFAAKRAAPSVSLGMLFAASQLADLAWPVLVLAGVERFEIRPGLTAVTPLDFIHYPYSHSLVALAIWGIALAAAYRLVRGGGARAFAVIAALVVSHWFLDVLMHRPDMPIALGDSPKVGLGVWNSIPASLAVELLLFAACAAWYARITRARNAAGRWGFGALVAFFLVVYIASVFGPPPPSVQAVAWTAFSMWLLVAWGHWVDRNRVAA